MSVQRLSDDLSYQTRAEFISALQATAGDPSLLGSVVWAGGHIYLLSVGSTVIADLPGFVPAKPVFAQHFGAVNDGSTNSRDAFHAAAAYLATLGGGALTAEAGSYVTDSEWTLPAGVDLVDLTGRINIIVTQDVKPLNRAQDVSLHLGQIASRCRFPDQVASGVTKAMARSVHVASDDVTSVRVVLPAAYVSNSTFAEMSTGGDITYRVSVEYPASTFTPVLFSGSVNGIATANTLLVSDSVSVSIPKGEEFFIRQFATGAVGTIPFQAMANQVSGSRGDACLLSSSATDLTMSGTPINTNSTSLMTPVAIIASTTRRSYGVVGDSRAHGYLDTGANPNGAGAIERNMRGAGTINVSYNGSTTAGFLASHTLRAGLINSYCTDVIVAYGVDDLARGVSAAQVQSNVQDILVLFSSLAGHVATVAPKSISTDSWVTEGNQMAFAQEPQRAVFNATVRAGQIAGATSFVDVAAAVESRVVPGVWKANLTDDGVNLNGAGYRETTVSNPTTGGKNCVYVASTRDAGSARSTISGVHFTTRGGDGGCAVSTAQDNRAFFANGIHVVIDGCAFYDADLTAMYPANPDGLSQWGWGRALWLAHSNGSAFTNNDVVGAFNPVAAANQNNCSVGGELATDGSNGIVAVEVSMNRLWYLHTPLFIGEDVLAFWFEKNECIKCYRGVYAPADPLGDGVASQADSRVMNNYLTTCIGGIDFESRQLFHIEGNHTNSDPAYFDNKQGFTGIRLTACTKGKVFGNSQNLASGQTAKVGSKVGVQLNSCTSIQVIGHKVSRYFDDAFYLNASNYIQFSAIELTQVSNAAFAFLGECRFNDIGSVMYVTAEPTVRYRFDDANTNVHRLSICDEF